MYFQLASNLQRSSLPLRPEYWDVHHPVASVFLKVEDKHKIPLVKKKNLYSFS